MVTFEAIMETAEREKMGVIVRNCNPISVAEAKAAIKNHPELEMKITPTKDAGTCIAIAPRGFHADEAIRVAGHENVARIFKKKNRW